MKQFSRISAFVPLVITMIWLHFLPDQVPLHFDFHGNIDRWGSKWEQLLLPAVALVMALVFVLAERAQLKKAAEDEKLLARTMANMKVMQVAMLAGNLMFTGITITMLCIASRGGAANNAKSSEIILRVAAILVGFTFLINGNYMPKVKMNSIIGFRCGWSMLNDMTWQKCNRFAGQISILLGFVLIVCSALLPTNWISLSFIVLLSLSIICDLLYAAKVYREEKAKG